MTENKKTIQIFSDESGYGADNRIGALAKIVGEKHVQKELNQILSDILFKYEIVELKFKNINNFRKVNAAKEFIDTVLNHIAYNTIGVHILVWDKQDSRHQVQARCDIANLCRMYYHNLRSINKQWKVEANWEFYPDEFSAIDWKKDVIKFINDKPLKQIANLESDLFGFYKDLHLTYSKVVELCSKSYPVLQLADLFAGLCRTSRQEHISYASWVKSQSNQQLLFDSHDPLPISKTLQYKFLVKKYFKEQSSKLNLGVNISKNGYLQTFKPSRKLSIWHYTPQSEHDKAPSTR